MGVSVRAGNLQDTVRSVTTGHLKQSFLYFREFSILCPYTLSKACTHTHAHSQISGGKSESIREASPFTFYLRSLFNMSPFLEFSPAALPSSAVILPSRSICEVYSQSISERFLVEGERLNTHRLPSSHVEVVKVCVACACACSC